MVPRKCPYMEFRRTCNSRETRDKTTSDVKRYYSASTRRIIKNTLHFFLHAFHAYLERKPRVSAREVFGTKAGDVN
jgi:hypothetical protein